ncbi:MAG TPA: hydrogenase iron-sulfur subunit, partial [Anaerolineales bacterium]|nr:hydrogenase iron-sulfur subunit [Anaerolineales bacterium]
KRVLVQMGVEPARLKLLWASAAEGAMLAAEINKFVEEVRALGPLNWPASFQETATTPVMEEVRA